jgi:glycosyltransferase involved in cell wall biosynthesis
MEMAKPLVSVCIPTFDGEEFIKEAISSALNQTYRDIEIIISDDNSRDKTLEIVKSFIQKSNIPIHIYHHKPGSIGENWNNCVEMTNGEYIKFLFQDDLLEMDCIEKMMNMVNDYNNIGLVFCRRKIIFDKNNSNHVAWVTEFKELHTAWDSLKRFQEGRKLLKDKSLLEPPRNKVGEPTAVLLNKKVFGEVGYFNTSLKQALDYEFWYRIFTGFNVAFVDQELVSFRLHNNQATASNAKAVISDYYDYPGLIYKNCFFYLNPRVQCKLFFEYNFLSKLLRKIKHRCIK